MSASAKRAKKAWDYLTLKHAYHHLFMWVYHPKSKQHVPEPWLHTGADTAMDDQASCIAQQLIAEEMELT